MTGLGRAYKTICVGRRWTRDRVVYFVQGCEASGGGVFVSENDLPGQRRAITDDAVNSRFFGYSVRGVESFRQRPRVLPRPLKAERHGAVDGAPEQPAHHMKTGAVEPGNPLPNSRHGHS